MNEYPIEDVHRLLDELEEVRRELSDRKGRDIDVNDCGELSLIVLEVLGWTSPGYMGTALGIETSILNKFVKMRGKVPLHVARAVADRLRSFLRSQDQAHAKASAPKGREKKPKAKQQPNSITRTIRAESWVVVRRNSDAQMKIGAIASLLESIVQQTRHANAPPDEQILNDIERAQLIAVLETALNVLRSPLVEKGLLKRTRKALESGAESAIEKGAQLGLGKLMEAAAARLGDLLTFIATG